MSKRIRVAQMVYSFHIEKGGGGITRCAIEIAENIDLTQFQLSVFGLGLAGSEDEEKWIGYLNDLGIQTFAATQWIENRPYRSFFNAYKSLLHEISRQPIDIIHSHSEFTDIMAAFLKLQGKVPYILRTTHYGYPIEWRNKPLRRAIFTNFLYPLIYNCEVGVNPSMRERLNNRTIARRLGRETLFINEAVHLERFVGVKVDKEEKKRSLGIPPKAPLIGCVGRLVEQKGYTYLLEAIAMVQKTRTNYHFLIIGDGPLADELKNQAQALGISDNVVFAGSRTDVEELLVCLDLFAMASLWEGMPISVLESMASNVPVLTTDVPGSRDLLQHGQSGWLVPPQDSLALGQAILLLMESPSIREALAKNARETLENYSSSAVAERYESLYRTLVQGKM